MPSFSGVDFYDISGLLSEEERAIRDTVRQWVDDRLMPIIGDCYVAGRFPRELVAGMAELGMLGANLPEAYGCAGLNSVAYGLIMQELERGDSGIRSFASVQGALVMYPIYAFGSEEQKRRWLPALAAGTDIGCFGLTEPDYGSNPAGMITTARQTADGWVLNGAKMWITNGSQATVAVVWAKTGDLADAKSVRGFLVPTDTRGFSARDQKGKLSLAPPTPASWCSRTCSCRRTRSSPDPVGSRARSCASPRRATASRGAPSAPRWPATTRRSATPGSG